MITAYRSDIGRIRLVNEDRGWASAAGNGLLLAIVADGMGGHQAGDVASQLAVDTFQDAMRSIPDTVSLDEGKMLLRQGILQANEVVFEMASRNERYHNMGTTVVAVLLRGENGIVGHIGDSRAYKISNGAIRCLTEDHTLVNELAKSGQISAEEAANHPRRNVLTRALGTDREVEVDIKAFAWSIGDTLLLCSDGLSNMVSDGQLLETINDTGYTWEEKAQRLIELALLAGGDDNITVVLIHNVEPAGEEDEYDRT